MRNLPAIPTEPEARHPGFMPPRLRALRIALAAALLLSGPVYGVAQSDASVKGALTDQDRPFPNGLVVLQHMKDERCAKLYYNSRPSAEEIQEARSCVRDLPWINTDAAGHYEYSHLAPGWYNIRFLWLLGKLPPTPAPATCSAGEWVTIFEPEKDRSGRYNAMALGKPFEVKEGESREINFDYRDQLNGGPNCAGGVPHATPPVKLENLGNARISIPGVKGVLELNVGPTPWETKVRSQSEIYLTAMDRPDNLLISAFLQQVLFAATPEKCRAERWPNAERALRNHKVKLEHVQQSTRGDFALVEFMLPGNHVEELRMKDIHAYWGNGDLCAEVHLSKVQFQPEDYRLFEQVLASTHFLPDESPTPVMSVDPSVAAYLAQASKLYIKKNYAEAASYYQKALDMEKQKRTLNPDMFRVLVDNLGMSYGISGNQPKAKEIFDYGITQDATYPLFYYNLACTYGEMGKMEEALGQLRLAYKYRANMIPGEGPVPDPLKDDSFRNFVKNDTFVQAVREMQRQQ